MYDHFYVHEFLMNAREQDIQKTAREAWKWSDDNPASKGYRLLISSRKKKQVPCCPQPLRACC